MCLPVRRRPCVEDGVQPLRRVVGAAGRVRSLGSFAGRLQRSASFVSMAAAMALSRFWWSAIVWQAIAGWLGLLWGIFSMSLEGTGGSGWFWDGNGWGVAGIWAGVCRGRRRWRGLAGWLVIDGWRGLVRWAVFAGSEFWHFGGGIEIKLFIQGWRWWSCVWSRRGIDKVEYSDIVRSNFAAPISGRLGSESFVRQRNVDYGSLFSCFVCFWFLVFWLGQFRPYSLELGLGFKVVSWLWCFSCGLIVSILVCCCHQFADKRSLHVVWYVWSAVWKRTVIFLAVVYEVLSRLLGLFCISSLWKAIIVVRVWAPLAHGICNRVGVKVYVSPIYWDVRGSLITRFVGKGDTTVCRSRIM